MHYIIGDTHGHYTCLMELLEKLNLTAEDTVILVGDILDRAPSPEEQKNLIDWCLENITPDGPFQMVLGNHELEHDKIITSTKKLVERLKPNEPWQSDYAYDYLFTRDHRYNFYQTCREMEIDLDMLHDLIQSLPLFKELEIDDKKYFVTHSWLLTKSHIGIEEYLNGEITAEDFDIEESVWDRVDNSCSYPTDYFVIHGHTPTITYEGTAEIDRKEQNINIDCGLFVRDMEGVGNLAAYCIETDAVTYLYKEEKEEE